MERKKSLGRYLVLIFFCCLFLNFSFVFPAPVCTLNFLGDASPPTASYSLTKMLSFSSEKKLVGHLITRHSHLVFVFFPFFCTANTAIFTPRLCVLKKIFLQVTNLFSIWDRRVNSMCDCICILCMFKHCQQSSIKVTDALEIQSKPIGISAHPMFCSVYI